MIGPLDIAHLASERDVSRYTDKMGVRLPSVTEVLALAGLVDLGGIPIDLLEKGAARGRIVHHVTAELDHMTAEVDRRKRLLGHEEYLPYFDAWAKFRSDTGFVPERIETSLVSHRFRFAGTFDRFGAESLGRKVLLDVKTSIVPASWWALQLAGYHVLAEEEALAYGKPLGPVERWSVQLGSDGRYALQRYRSPSDRSDFLAALRVAHFLLRTRRYVLP